MKICGKRKKNKGGGTPRSAGGKNGIKEERGNKTVTATKKKSKRHGFKENSCSNK